MSESVNVAGGTTGTSRPLDNRGLPIYSKEERISRWNQAEAAAAARRADPSLLLSDMTPEERARGATAAAEYMAAMQQAQERGCAPPRDSSPPGPKALVSNPREREALDDIRRSMLSFLESGGVVDVMRAEINDEAADLTAARIRGDVLDLDRRLGRKPTDFSGRYPAAEKPPIDFSA